MKRLIVLSMMLMLVAYAFGQEINNTSHLDAFEIGPMMSRKTHNGLIELMKGNKCLFMDSSYAVYSVYSKREGKDIQIKAHFESFTSDTLRVWKVEYIYDHKNTYGTNDLQEAFWIEHLKDLCR